MAAGKLISGLLIQLVVLATYTESTSANRNIQKRHEKFVPLVAFSCGYRNQYTGENGEWISDKNRYATCFSGKLDILKYCKKVFPNLNITNIVEYSHEARINKWCREEGSPCKWTHNVRPYQCIDGEFHSEALQVPHMCQFSHVNSHSQCDDYQHWKDESVKQCSDKRSQNGKPMVMRSFAVLEPCALDMFTGVEFVCCPNEALKSPKTSSVSDDNDNDEDDDDDYADESYDFSEEDVSDSGISQDPYFKNANWSNEHEDFKKATERLEQRHRKKIDQVMQEWGELEARYSKMKKADPNKAEQFKQSMNNRFQRTVISLEKEHRKMKEDIENTHEERVIALLNEKKREATHTYRQALATHLNKPNKHNVLMALKTYIRTEEKDRMHTLNRYRHLLRTNKEEATAYKPTVFDRLRYVDLRINGTLALLRDFPDLDKHVRPIALTYWQDYRRENTPELTDREIQGLNSLDEEAKNKKLVDLYAEAFEKVHSADKLDVKAPTTTTFATTVLSQKTEEPIRVLPTEESDSEEDKDEYYEDEDDEQVKRVQNKKISVIEISTKEALPMKVKKIVEAPKLVETSIQTDSSSESDENEDESDSSSSVSSSSSESVSEENDTKIRELHVDIEPIIDDPESNYHHEKLIQPKINRSESVLRSTYFMFITLTMASVCITGFIATVVRRRRAMRGFIEVDVYTPEERHVAGMQVNGYENPTYSFFDSKA